MSSKPDSSDKLEKRLPAGGQAVTGGWGAEDVGAWGPAERWEARLTSVQGSGGWRGPGASLADSHVALWTRGGGGEGPPDHGPPWAGARRHGQGW